MKILYTGAKSYLAAQPDPSLSLGGWASMTAVPLKRPNGMFEDISYLSQSNGYVITKAFILMNDLELNITNVNIGYSYPLNANFKIEIAIVSLANEQEMELIPTSRDTPWYADFNEANIDVDKDVDNSVLIGDMASGKKFGMWIRRTSLIGSIPDVLISDFKLNIKYDIITS